MSKRSRIVGFGSAGLLVLAGIVCAVAFSGGLGQNLAFGLVALGLIEGTALVFYEVGLTEDRDRARNPVPTKPVGSEPKPEPEHSDDRPPRSGEPKRAHPPERSARARLERMRGRPRRLR